MCKQVKDNKGLRWNNRREEAVLCEPSDRQHKIDRWFCCIKNWWLESAFSGSDLNFPHFASLSSSLVVPNSASPVWTLRPATRDRRTERSTKASFLTDRPVVPSFTRRLSCVVERARQKWKSGCEESGVALTIRGIIEQYRLLFDLEISQSDHQCLENQVGCRFNFKKKFQLHRSKYHRELSVWMNCGLGQSLNWTLNPQISSAAALQDFWE